MLKKSLITLSVYLLISTFCNIQLFSQESLTYQEPPSEIIELVDAPATPSVRISPDRDKILYIENPGLPSIEDLAREELRLAGIRIDPLTNGSSRASYGTGLSLADIDGENYREVSGLPSDPRIRNVTWSPDGSKVAFTQTIMNGIELWVVDV